MLKTLRIKNVALVDEVDLQFGPGLNVITGETGAGKSILIGAIGLTLGDRAHSDTVRDEKASVEATFGNGTNVQILKREVRLDGRTKAWIDNHPATITILKNSASNWVELTAQREGAALLDITTHLIHLDRFASLTQNAIQLSEMYSEWQNSVSQLKTIDLKIERLKETEELAKFQLNEILAFAPKVGEEDELGDEIRILEGAETLIIGLSQTEEMLDQGEEPISDNLAVVISKIEELRSIDKSLEQTCETLNTALESIRQASTDLRQHRDSVHLDPERLEELRDRHDRLQRLMSKYGGSMESLMRMWQDLEHRENSTFELEKQRRELQKQLAEHLGLWEKIALDTSEQRKKSSELLASIMEDELRSVGVEHPVFKLVWLEEIGDLVEFPKTGKHRVSPSGLDQIEFQISFNPGHDPKPIQNVASGGELSRIMLLLKGIGPSEKSAPVMIFDEIDTGISGKTARRVGLRLKELSKTKQVVLVTHLPQIASLADRHIIVEKISDLNETQVTFKHVEKGSNEHVDEIARLLGGEVITDTTRATARELME
jgi:DNA repair protein RecN (Recombination protein N)